VTQRRVEYKSTIPQGTNEGLDLWEVVVVVVVVASAAVAIVVVIE